MTKIHYIVALNNEGIYNEYIGTYFKANNIEPILVTNDMGDSMFKKYNVGLDLIKDNIKKEDVVCFVHEDIKILDKYFEKQVEMVFEARHNIGMLGVYGVTQFVRDGGWWMCDRPRYARGQIMQGRPDLKEPFHMTEGNIGLYDDLVSVDGCIFMLRGSIAKSYRFDEATYNGYHFYDVDTAFTLVKSGYDVAVADILVEHASEGPLSESWKKNRDKFVQTWERLGLTFPATVDKLRNLPI